MLSEIDDGRFVWSIDDERKALQFGLAQRRKDFVSRRKREFREAWERGAMPRADDPYFDPEDLLKLKAQRELQRSAKATKAAASQGSGSGMARRRKRGGRSSAASKRVSIAEHPFICGHVIRICVDHKSDWRRAVICEYSPEDQKYRVEVEVPGAPDALRAKFKAQADAKAAAERAESKTSSAGADKQNNDETESDDATDTDNDMTEDPKKGDRAISDIETQLYGELGERRSRWIRLQKYRIEEYLGVAWVKIKGHPWWPVRMVREHQGGSGAPKPRKPRDKITVLFFGTDEHARVAPRELVPWESRLGVRSRSNNAKLQSAVQMGAAMLALLMSAKAEHAAARDLQALRLRDENLPAEDWVGRRVSIYFDGDNHWFNATVRRLNRRTGRHYVLYDDGECEWTDMTAFKRGEVRLLKPKPQRKSGRGNAMAGEDAKADATTAATAGEGATAMDVVAAEGSADENSALCDEPCWFCRAVGADAEGETRLSCTGCKRTCHKQCFARFRKSVEEAGRESLNPVLSTTSVKIDSGAFGDPQRPWCNLCSSTCEHCGLSKKSKLSVLLACEVCQRRYHSTCLDPPLQCVPTEGWICSECLECQCCGARRVGGSANASAPSSRPIRARKLKKPRKDRKSDRKSEDLTSRGGEWMHDSVCTSCTERFELRQYCPGCLKPTTPADRGNTIACSVCLRHVHRGCSGLSTAAFEFLEQHPECRYDCPECVRRKGANHMVQLLNRLIREDALQVFMYPVRDDVAPNYSLIIRTPMEFSTVRRKITELSYSGLEALRNHINLIWRNALDYNPEASLVAQLALRLQKLSLGLFERLRELLDRVKADQEWKDGDEEALLLFAERERTAALAADREANGGGGDSGDAATSPADSYEVTFLEDDIVEAEQTATDFRRAPPAVKQLPFEAPAAAAGVLAVVDVCGACGSSGAPETLVFCMDCGEGFHEFCLHGHAARRLERAAVSPTGVLEWQCDNCAFCVRCRTDRDAQTVGCETCGSLTHLGCVNPPLTKLTGKFRCHQCVRCRQCGARTPEGLPGARRRGSAANPAAWMYEFTMCQPCGLLYRARKYCPVCDRLWNDNEKDDDFVQCDRCKMWVHTRCDDILSDETINLLDDDVTYFCPGCRRDPGSLDFRPTQSRGLSISPTLVKNYLYYRQLLLHVTRSRYRSHDTASGPDQRLLRRVNMEVAAVQARRRRRRRAKLLAASRSPLLEQCGFGVPSDLAAAARPRARAYVETKMAEEVSLRERAVALVSENWKFADLRTAGNQILKKRHLERKQQLKERMLKRLRTGQYYSQEALVDEARQHTMALENHHKAEMQALEAEVARRKDMYQDERNDIQARAQRLGIEVKVRDPPAMLPPPQADVTTPAAANGGDSKAASTDAKAAKADEKQIDSKKVTPPPPKKKKPKRAAQRTHAVPPRLRARPRRLPPAEAKARAAEAKADARLAVYCGPALCKTSSGYGITTAPAIMTGCLICGRAGDLVGTEFQSLVGAQRRRERIEEEKKRKIAEAKREEEARAKAEADIKEAGDTDSAEKSAAPTKPAEPAGPNQAVSMQIDDDDDDKSEQKPVVTPTPAADTPEAPTTTSLAVGETPTAAAVVAEPKNEPTGASSEIEKDVKPVISQDLKSTVPATDAAAPNATAPATSSANPSSTDPSPTDPSSTPMQVSGEATESRQDATLGLGTVRIREQREGRLLPVVSDRNVCLGVVHAGCAVWSPEVTEEPNGELRGVATAIRTARAFTCAACGSLGASLRCALPECQRRFHLGCLLSGGGAFLTTREVYCPDHTDEVSGSKLVVEMGPAANARRRLVVRGVRAAELSEEGADALGDDGSQALMRVDSPPAVSPPIEESGRLQKYPLDALFLPAVAAREARRAAEEAKAPAPESQAAQDVPSDSEPALTRSGALCVLSLGNIEWEDARYHDAKYIYPPGFRSSRMWWATGEHAGDTGPAPRVAYTCEILRGSDAAPGPRFRISLPGATSDDPPRVLADEPTAGAAWRALTKLVPGFEERNAKRTPRSSATSGDLRPFGLSGAHFFGFGVPEVLRKIEFLSGAHRCAGYSFLFRTDAAAMREAEDKAFDPRWLTDPTNPYGITAGPPECKADADATGPARTKALADKPAMDVKKWLSGPDPFAAMTLRQRRYMRYGEDTKLKTDERYRRLKIRRPKCVVKPSPIHAWGLFASEFIAKDEMVIEYLGELIRQTVADIRERRYELDGIGSCYMFRIDDAAIVDSTFRGNISRFINHSCDPNCYTRVVSYRGEKKIVVFAKRDIEHGMEITYDYKFQSETGEGIPCRCGAYNCAGRLN